MSDDARWILLYTKANAEAWAEANLRRQGFDTLLPRVRYRGAVSPLFPRYLFARHVGTVMPRSIENTFGIQYVVRCGEYPAHVPVDVIEQIRGRMNAQGVVRLDMERPDSRDQLLAARQRDRLAALERFAAAGFRVRAA